VLPASLFLHKYRSQNYGRKIFCLFSRVWNYGSNYFNLFKVILLLYRAFL
jgi:hypothetical protein